MGNENKPFFKRKTTWAALLSLATAVVGAKTGQVDVSSAVTLVGNALLALGLRSALEPK